MNINSGLNNRLVRILIGKIPEPEGRLHKISQNNRQIAPHIAVAGTKIR